MLQCHKCGSSKIWPSRSRSRWEVWRKKLTSMRTYRCQACGWRGWKPHARLVCDRQHLACAAAIVAADAPDLKALDYPDDLEEVHATQVSPPRNISIPPASKS